MTDPIIPRRPDAECFQVNEKTLGKPPVCPTCNGSGMVGSGSANAKHMAFHYQPCPTCKASKTVADFQDIRIKGSAVVDEEHVLVTELLNALEPLRGQLVSIQNSNAPAWLMGLALNQAECGRLRKAINAIHTRRGRVAKPGAEED